MPVSVCLSRIMWVGSSRALGLGSVLLDRLHTLRDALNFVFTAIILPLQRLKICQVVGSPKRDRHDMIDLPAVTAGSISKILAHDGPSPRIDAQSLIDAHGAG